LGTIRDRILYKNLKKSQL